MFVGHFGVGFGVKCLAPKTSLGTLVLSAMLADLLLFVFVAMGIEHIAIQPDIPRVDALDLYDFAWSHSLWTGAVWGALAAGGYWLVRRYKRGAGIVLAAVLSHWVLDRLSHRPDMALAPGVHRYFGLGLYNSPLGLLVVEGGIWIAGIIVYIRATRSKALAGNWTLSIAVVRFTALWLLRFKGVPPPSVRAAVVVELIFLPLAVGWMYWIDGLREVRQSIAAAAKPTTTGAS